MLQEEGEPAALASLPSFQALIKEWDEEHVAPSYDSTAILHKMAEILEKETNVYNASDPDPFEERHPSRVDSECQLGLVLKAYFKKESLVSEVLSNYLKENYWTRMGISKSSFDLNVASCRLVLDIMPGLETNVISDTDGLVPQLYKWTESAEEPLRSYATGLLAVAMELSDIATDPDIREKNTRLVPEMLKRLIEMQKQAVEERDHARSERFKRPFALFSKSPLKNPRRLSNSEDETPKSEINTNSGDSTAKLKELPAPAMDRSGSGRLAPGWPCGMMSPPRGGPRSAENSNSSWAEMELNVIGHFEIHPLTPQASQIFILRLLTPLAEYQEFLSFIHEWKILDVLKSYINVRETRDSRLAFEALRLLASLFCHKKFTMEWVTGGGLQLLMEMPRPSIAATGSSMCLYYLAHDDDTMEKICNLPEQILDQLVKFSLWLLECSHDSGRQYAVMFFGLAFPFRVVLELFDKHDGLRKLYNTISTLKILSHSEEPEIQSDEDEFMQRMMVKHTTATIKRYVESHLTIRAEQAVSFQMRQTGESPQPEQPHYKANRPDQEQVTAQIDKLLELMNYRARWEPIDQLIKLGGIQLLLQITALAYDWNFTGRAETVKSALDILAVTAIIPRVQLQLCEKFELPDESTVGMNIILGSAEGEIVPDAPEVQLAALHVLCHLLCGPVVRPGCPKNSATPSSKKKISQIKSSDEVIKRVWECVRSNNGIMVLLSLIQTKIPLTDADSIRALACKALVGLARSDSATQIMSKLPIFSNGNFNMLLREPVLQDKRSEHVKFQKEAHKLFNKVSGPGNSNNDPAMNSDVTLDMLHRQQVVANTRIRFGNKQLLQLMHEHLILSGLTKTAETLKKEGNILPLTAESGTGPPTYPVRSQITATPSHHAAPTGASRRLTLSPTNPPTSATPNSRTNTPTNATPNPRTNPPSSATPNQRTNATPNNPTNAARPILIQPRPSTTPRVLPATPASTARSSSSISTTTPRSSTTPSSNSTTTPRSSNMTSSSLNIRVNRTPVPTTASTTRDQTSPARWAMKPMEGVDGLNNKTAQTNITNVTLGGIVTDYLSNQHALCRNPMTTCPEFDLLLPHKCPDPRSRRAAPLNFSSRLTKRSTCPPWGGPEGAKLDRKLIYSRFRPIKSFRSPSIEDQDNPFTALAFSADDQFLLAGTFMGDVKFFNLSTGGEEASHPCHDSFINHIQPSRDNKFVITSSSWRSPYSKLWSMGEFFTEKYQFKDEEYLEFAKMTEDKIVGTRGEGVATVYDLETGKQVRLLKPTSANAYSRNRACFDPTDELILSDGVLWDYRVQRQIHKFDKLNQTLSGVFHPNGLEIISNTEVWDIRTFHLIKTVPQLDQCQVVFNNTGDIIFGLNLEQEADMDDEPKYETAFKTFEASDYSSIATIETKKSVIGLQTSRHDLMLAVVEQGLVASEESSIRLYDIGRLRAEEEDVDEEEEEEEEELDDDSDSDEAGEGGADDDGDEDDDDDWGFPIPLFSDDENGDDLSGSGTGSATGSVVSDVSEEELSVDDPDEDADDDEEMVNGNDDEAANDSWEDIEDEDDT